ncbi:MAG: Fic family protein [Clostridia bacterium]
MKNKLNIKLEEKLNEKELEFFCDRFSELVDMELNVSNIEDFKYIHFYLFQDIFEWAGIFRKINIDKPEKVLGGLSLVYSDYNNIESNLNELFNKMNKIDINKITKDELINKIIKIVKNIWLIHPFREGNTRTVIVYLFKFLDNLDIKINKLLFSKNSKYVRSAFVAATFEDKELNIMANEKYLYDILNEAIKF